MKKKVIILTGSFGQGHNSAADALKNQAEKMGFESKVIDVVNFFYQSPGKITKKFHEEFCENYPKLWKLTFDIFDDKRVARLIYGINNPLLQEKVNKFFENEKPDIIISVFPFWLGFIKHYIKSFGKQFQTGVVITDAISLHSLWYLRGDYIDKYFVIDDLTKKEFIDKFDHKQTNVGVSFFPIDEEVFISKNNIGNKKIYILLSSISEKFVLGLIKQFENTNFNLTIIKGRNDVIYDKIKIKYNKTNNIDFFDYIDLKKEYRNIDIFIGKAGGALVSECIATDTPIIVPNYLLGQEEGNVKLIEKYNVGIYEKNPEKVAFLIKYINRNLMKSNFIKLKKNNSCKMILDSFNNDN